MENDSKDSATSLETYLNSISISSLPCIRDSPVLEVKVGDSVRDAIHLLYENNVSVALITDSSSDTFKTKKGATSKPSDRYIGIISFSSMVLWCIERLKEDEPNESHKEVRCHASLGFFSRLDRNLGVKQTKVGELAKFFLFDAFLPVHLESDTLFHVLLLLSKHQLLVLPVIEGATHQVTGFITKNAIANFLLQASGLVWFDNIANMSLSEFRFQRENSACQLYADQSVSKAFSVLSDNRVPAVAVVDRKTEEIVGNVKKSDIIVLLENDTLFSNCETTTLDEFIKMNVDKVNNEKLQRNSLVQSLRLRESFTLHMDSPVIHKGTDSLKQVMVKVTDTNTEASFIVVDDRSRVVQTLTVYDIIIQFAPHDNNSTFEGGGFFESMLTKAGCHVENGSMIYDH